MNYEWNGQPVVVHHIGNYLSLTTMAGEDILTTPSDLKVLRRHADIGGRPLVAGRYAEKVTTEGRIEVTGKLVKLTDQYVQIGDHVLFWTGEPLTIKRYVEPPAQVEAKRENAIQARERNRAAEAERARRFKEQSDREAERLRKLGMI